MADCTDEARVYTEDNDETPKNKKLSSIVTNAEPEKFDGDKGNYGNLEIATCSEFSNRIIV